jgi:hypothetical protein
MSHKQESLLAQIEAGVLDDSVPVASLLQKCIVLGGQAGSEEMRDWARQELNGYQGEPVPPYRRIYTGPDGEAHQLGRLQRGDPANQPVGHPSADPRLPR